MSKEIATKPDSSPDLPAAAGAAGHQALRHPLGLGLGLLATAFLFAGTEIQIEGAAGWARNLPTWRIEQHPLLDLLWGGKELTGYHAWVFSFMAAVFHLPLILTWRWNWRMEARILGSLMVFWILEDALWFALNPAFGIHRLSPQFVPWHKHWVLGIPVDYPIFLSVGASLIAWSFWRNTRREINGAGCQDSGGLTRR